jgi:hypothetical protein
MNDDDDIQEYLDARKFNEMIFRVNELARDAALEEVALEFDNLRIAFGDTAASFAQYVREMKNAKT